MAGPSGWNATIASGGTASFGFNATGNLTTMPPMECMPA
jgi:chitin-binding protein